MINPAEANRKKQCKQTETIPNSNTIHRRKRHNHPTHSSTPTRVKYVNAHMLQVYRDAAAFTRSSGRRPPSTCTHRLSQPAAAAAAEGVDATCVCVVR